MRLYLTALGILAILHLVGKIDAAVGDGGWTDWSRPFSCTKTCGGGTQKRWRDCLKPQPQPGGKCCENLNGTCATHEKGFVSCSTQPCFDGWSAWENDCAFCEEGTRTKHTMCGGLKCTGPKASTVSEPCNRWNKTDCPSPCDAKPPVCPKLANCIDKSTDKKAMYTCECVMHTKMNPSNTSCVAPPPTTPTQRPIPTMEAAQKVIATVISKSASSVLIVFVSITLIMFIIGRIFTPDRVIQMNMEISLLLAHVCLMLPASIIEMPICCRIVSMLIHYLFTACYIFIMLEALHMYSLVAYVVKKDGMFSRLQNILIGWGLAAVVLMFTICFEYDHYGGEYHCWLQMNTKLAYGTFIPVIAIVIITFTLIEAAGAAEYKPLKGIDMKQLTSARISQRTNLIILPFMIAHWMVGMMSEYEQNLALYSIFSILNGILGFLVFFLHCTNNQVMREKLKSMFSSVCRG